MHQDAPKFAGTARKISPPLRWFGTCRESIQCGNQSSDPLSRLSPVLFPNGQVNQQEGLMYFVGRSKIFEHWRELKHESSHTENPGR
jgi:hypothetical protein